MKKFRMKYIVKEYAIVEVTAEDEEKAKEQILKRANEGEFDGDMVGDDCEFECLDVKDVLSYDELKKKYKDLCVTGAEDTFVRLWDRFINEYSFFKEITHDIHIHENTRKNLVMVFKGDNEALLDGIFDNDNDQGVYTYSQDAKWFYIDGDGHLLTENTVDDMTEHIITDWCWDDRHDGGYTGCYIDCWRRVMEFFLEHYDEEEEKRMEEIRKQNRKED